MDNQRKIKGLKYFINIKPSDFNGVEVIRLHKFLNVLLLELEPEQLPISDNLKTTAAEKN